MSYLVCHVQKFKSSDVRGIQIHNQRESKNNKNKDIDPQKTKLNYDLHNPNPINYTQRVKEIIKEGYTGSRAIRKDAVVMNGILISSDNGFFKTLKPVEQKEFFNAAYEKIKDLYGEDKIVSAKVHMDETTPHMHVSLVPLIDGTLSSKKLFDRKALRKLQDEMPKYLKDKGFKIERGEENSENTHVDPNEYKRNEREKIRKEMEKEIKQLENEIRGLRADLRSDIALTTLNPKKSLLGANLTLKQDEYDTLIRIAKKSVIVDSQNELLKMSSESKTKDIDAMTKTVDKLTEQVKKLQSKYDKLIKKYDHVYDQAKFMKNFLDDHDLLDEAKELRKDMAKDNEDLEKEKVKEVIKKSPSWEQEI
jgi:hypothetical protein